MEKNLYEQPFAMIMPLASESLLNGATIIKNGDDEPDVPVIPGNPPGGIGAKEYDIDYSFEDNEEWED